MFLLTLLPAHVMAGGDDPVIIDGISYTLIAQNKVAKVVANPEANYTGHIIIPSIIKFEGSEYSVESICENAFSGMSGVISVKIPKSISSIDVSAFSGCSNLNSIEVDKGNRVYDSRDNCNAIIQKSNNQLIIGCNSTIIPNSVQAIGSNAFSGSGIASIDIPLNVTLIYGGAFQGCKNLKTIDIPESITYIESFLFRGSGLTSVTIPNSVTYIGSYAFEDCYDLKSVSLPNSVDFMGDWAFSHCQSLSSFTIPGCIKTIKKNTFSYCTNMNAVYIPKGVTEIEDLAFEGCKELSNVYCFADEVPTLGQGSFYLPIDNHSTLHVPANSIEKYQNADIWGRFNNIVALSNDDLKKYDNNIEPEIDNTVEGVYFTQPDSYRMSGGTNTDYGRNFELIIIDNGDGTYYVDDLFGGWYSQRAGYGPKYSMFGTIEIATDGSIILINSYVPGWGNSLSGLTGTYDPNTLTFSIEADYLGMKFHQTWVKSGQLFNVGGINYCIGKNNTVSVKRGKYEGDIEIPEEVSYNGTAYTVTSVGTAFRNCTELKSISLPNSLTTIDGFSFYGCNGLTKVILPKNLFVINDGVFAECSNLTSITIPSNVISIAGSAFLGCKSLSSINLPNSLTLIGETAFDGCTGLTSLIIPNNVFSIGESAFADCSSITSLTIGSGVSEIKEYAFSECPGLTNVYCYAERVPNTETNAFLGSYTESTTLHVPTASIESYMATAPWKEFKTIVEIERPETIPISSANQVTYMSDKNLDFTSYPDLKVYVATGYDKVSGTIWLTRVKEVPANTGFLLMGDAGDYEIPVKKGDPTSYYMNLFKGTIEGTTIQTTDGDNTNYYLSNGSNGLGFYKVQSSVTLKPNRAYLSVPTEIAAVGTVGSTETIKVSSAGQVPYYNTASLDFSSLDAQGVKAYTATGYDYSTGTIWLTRVKHVPAETGILIMAPQGEYLVPTASVASVYANMFKGTLTGTTIQTHETIAGEDYINYYLSSGDAGVGFYKVTKEGGVTIGANRCYLPIKNQEASAGTRSAGSGQTQIAFEEADEVIGIPLFRGVEDDNDGTTNLTPALSKGEGEGDWYTLQGQRVAKPGKGIYIRNGKKVVIK